MRRVAGLILLWAATAWGGAGMFMAEMGVGAGLGGGAFFGTYALTRSLDEGWEFLIPTFAFMGGTGTGVYVAGEVFDGRSAHPWVSFAGAVGGASLGTAAGVIPGVLAAWASEGEAESEWAIFFGAVAGVTLGSAGGAWLYNAVKEPAAEGRSALPTATPAVSVLPRRPGEAGPTLVYGCAWAF